MGTIKQLLDGVSALNLRRQVPIIIEETQAEVIQLNRLQLYEGLNSKGDKVGLYQSVGYSLDKNKKNPKPGFGVVDLYDTGAFYKGFYLDVSSTSSKISSQDGKTDKLIKKYGEDIFGLTKESKAKYANGVFFEGLKKYISGKTGLKFR